MFYILILGNHSELQTELATSNSFASLEEAKAYQSTIHSSIKTKILKEFDESDEIEYRAKKFRLGMNAISDSQYLNNSN